MPDLKQSVGNVSLLLASVAVSLLLLELCYRFFLFGWDSLSIEKMNSLHNWGHSGMRQPSTDPELVYELKPNLRTLFKLAPFETNSRGLRDDEYSLQKPRGTFRIAVVGDSFTVPSGVRLEEAFHSRLEEWLNRDRDGSYEVINFGVPGYTLRQYRALVVRRVVNYDPDLVLVGFCARNDHIGELYNSTYRVKREVNSFFESFTLKGLRHLGKANKQDNTKLKTVRASADRRQYMMWNIRAMSRFSKRHAVPIVFAFLDNRPARLPFLEKALEKNGLYFVDTTESFRDRKFSDFTLHPLDSHPNGAANELFAEAIYRFLVEEELIGENGLAHR